MCLFDRPIIQNNLRGLYAELMVLELLGEGWRHAGDDWAAWDLQHEDGTRLEVKQSAASQSWMPSSKGYIAPRFSIGSPKQFWDGAKLVEHCGRQADIYVFAWHPVERDTADHREVGQWCFMVANTSALPEQKTIGLGPLNRFCPTLQAEELRGHIDLLRTGRNVL